MSVKKLAPYTELMAYNIKTNQFVRGIISSDELTLRIDVHDDLDLWCAIEQDGSSIGRSITWT